MWNQQYKGAKTESCAGGEKGLCVHVWQGNTSRDTQDYLRDEIDEIKFDCHKYNREIIIMWMDTKCLEKQRD